MKSSFKGHGIEALFHNVCLAFIPPIYILIIKTAFALNNVTFMIYALCFLLVFFFPNPIYLFFEIKHLLIRDGIAEPLDIGAFLAFGGLSLLGLTLQVTSMVMLINFLNLSGLGLIVVIPLSAITSIGGCLGLTDIASLQGMWPPTLIKHLRIVLSKSHLIIVCILTTILLTYLTLIFI